MSQFKCSVISCSSLSEVECNQCKQSMCRMHSEMHADEYLLHSLRELTHPKSDQIWESPLTLDPHEHSRPEYLLSTVFGYPHIFFLNAVPVDLPNDFQETLRMMCIAFIERILIMPKGKNEKIKSKCEKLSRAISNIIYNYRLNVDHLQRIVLDAYTSYHSGIEGITSEGLIALLHVTEEALRLPKSITKLFIYTVQLEQQKQIFIQKFFMQEKISIPELVADFYKTFKDFIPENHRDITRLFTDFEEYYQKEKSRIAGEARKDLIENITTMWTSTRYIRLTVHAYRSPNNSDCQGLIANSVTIASLILQKERPRLSSVVSLSETEVLIAISLETFTYFIYHSTHNSCISLILMAENVIIASGSTPNSIIISHTHPRSIDLYALNGLKLEKQSNLNFYLTPMETISDIVYIQALGKVVFLTKANIINSLLLQGGLRVPIQRDGDGESYLKLGYCDERKLVLIKTENYIQCFSMYMQYVYTVKAQGNQFTSCVNSSGEVEFLVHNNDRFIRVSVEFQRTKIETDRFLSKKRTNESFIPCTHTLAVILPERDLRNSNLYSPYFSRKFVNPNFIAG